MGKEYRGADRKWRRPCGFYSNVIALVAYAIFGPSRDLRSQPVRLGFFNGVALVVAIGQLARVFGFSNAGDGLLEAIRGFLLGAGQTQVAALAIGVSVLAFILACRRWWPRMPAVLLGRWGLVDHALSDGLAARGVELVFAELKDPVRERLVRYGLDDDIATRYFPTIAAAVSAYVEAEGVEWNDWEGEAR